MTHPTQDSESMRSITDNTMRNKYDYNREKPLAGTNNPLTSSGPQKK